MKESAAMVFAGGGWLKSRGPQRKEMTDVSLV
jgi:hypothetical protein